MTRYQPGQACIGLLVQIAERIHQLQDIAERNRHDPPLAAISAVAERVTFPADIWPFADERWRTLGCRSLSAYISGLIRYDLLVGGPHSYATGECRSKVQRAITRKTVAPRRKGGQRKILLEHLIEQTKGRRESGGNGVAGRWLAQRPGTETHATLQFLSPSRAICAKRTM